MHVNMIFIQKSFQNPHVFIVTDLNDQFSAPFLNVSCQHMITILRNPNQMDSDTALW
jgi:hypothetical protein